MERTIFSALSAYGSAAQENYLTESFVHVLRLLTSRDPAVGHQLLDRLLGIDTCPAELSPARVTFATQVRYAEGIPDIEITLEGRYRALIEVKHDAVLSERQLENYRDVLDRAPEAAKALVLLTRSRASSAETNLPAEAYRHVCWYEVHRWMRESKTNDEVLRFVLDDFAEFLEEKKMSLSRVTWEYENGVPALFALTAMLEAAIADALPDLKWTRTAGWTWRGFHLNNGIWTGVRYDAPTTLVFENNGGTNPTIKEDLSFGDSHFLALDSGAQLETLIQFLRSANQKLQADQGAPT